MTDTSTHIEEAYCVELDDTINIFEASDFYFSLPELKRKRLHFQCPDEECRREFHPEIVAVNYDKEIYERSPYFRRNPHDEHMETCILGRYESIYKNMMKNKKYYSVGSDRNLFLEDIEQTENLIDVYISKEELAEQNTHKTPKNINSIKIHNHSDKDIEAKIHHGYLKTRMLERVVTAFESLSKEERKIPKLTLCGRKMAYGTAFKNIIFIDEKQTWQHIYYGMAKIYRYNNPKGYRIFYNRQTKHYSDSIPNFSITAFFSEDELENQLVKKNFKKAADENLRCCVYMLAKKRLEYAAYGKDSKPKEWIILSADPSEVVIRFNVLECK